MKKIAVLIAGGTLASAMLLSVLGNSNTHLVNTPTTLADGTAPVPLPRPPQAPPPPTLTATPTGYLG
jgi:hypothetical protein